MTRSRNSRILAGLLAGSMLTTLVLPATAADFTISAVSTLQNGGALVNGNDTLTITGTGSVSTNTAGLDTIKATGFGNTVINQGLVQSGGAGGEGIDMTGVVGGTGTMTVTNSGRVVVTGAGSSGISIKNGDVASVTNTGSIVASGLGGPGIRATLSNTVTIVNSGSITSDGVGILANVTQANITSSGSITVLGAGASGIVAGGAGSTVTVSGSIVTNGGAAVTFTNPVATLNLKPGALLGGPVVFAAGTGGTLNVAPGMNANIVLGGAVPTTITAPGGVFALAGNRLVVADTGVLAAVDQSALAGNDNILRAVANHTARQTDVDFAPASIMSSKGLPGGTWGQVIGSGFLQTAGATSGAYSGYGLALVAGRDLDGGSGFFGGASFGSSRDNAGSAFSITTTSAFAGYYRSLGSHTKLTLMAGGGANASTRMIADPAVPGGIAYAKANYASYFVSPAVTLADVFGMENTSLRLRYLGVFSNAYTETGSTAAMSVAARATHFVEARLERETASGAGMKVRYGVDLGYRFGSPTRVTLAGNGLTMPDTNGLGARGYLGLKFGEGNKTGNLEIGANTDGLIDLSLSYKISF